MTGVLQRDTVTISDGTSSTSPDLVIRYAARRQSGNVFHDIIGRASRDVSLAPARLRAGTIECLYVDRAAAHAALTLHAGASILTYVDSTMPETDMSYAVEGISEITHDRVYNKWKLSVEFEELDA